MNLTITKEQMLNGLQAVQNIVSTRTSLPILSNVLLQAEEKRLELTATDLDVTITATVEANVKKAGATTIPVKKLMGIARELASADMDLEVDEKHFTTLQSAGSFFKIRGLAAEEFPPLPRFAEQKKVVVPQEKLKGMLKRTAFAVSADESRYVLNGTYLSLKDHKITIVATDGRRLAFAEEEVDVPDKSHGEFIVPAKAVHELTRLLQDKGDAEISFSENQVSFVLRDEKGPNSMLISKLIEGTYPNYRQVIPSETKERIALSREELLHALRRAEIMTTEKQTSVKLTFAKNNLAITANTPEVGEAREALAINYKGKEISIAFNPGFLIEPLTALTDDEVYIELIDELSPGVLKVNGPYLYVVMPMRLS